jgi:leucyl aminopeptidase
LSLQFSVSSSAADRVKAALLVVPVLDGPELDSSAEPLDAALDGELGTFMTEAAFTGKEGTTLAVPASGRLGVGAAVLVGVGKADELTLGSLRRAGAAAARKSRKATTVATTLVELADRAGLDRPDAAQAVAEGFALGSYEFLKYKRESKPTKLRRVIVLGGGGARVKAALERGSAVADAVSWARDMVNEPAGAKSPDAFARATQRFLRGTGVTVQVLSGAQLKQRRLGGIIGVGQGSEQPPRLVKLTYNPTGRARGTLALVGKGVIFDSGGLSIKTAGGMETMKTDMGGGAAVIAAMSVLRDLGVKARVIGFVPMVENMPSGKAIRPGDVLEIRNRKTVEVLNTDAEGRLILADGLSLAAEAKPDAIIDLATLTGACVVALGEKIAGLMGNDDAWIDQVRAAADRAGEPVWPLPLPREYRKLLDSEVADLRNIGTGGYGGALTAGLFLQEFVDKRAWAHLDIAGPARAPGDDGELVKGGTGFGVRTLVELASTFTKPTD